MQADFLDAHERHWEDAEDLHEAARYANADQLYGFAAECGLKRLLIAFGMKVNPGNGAPQQRTDWVHANGVWARYENYRSEHVQGGDYALPAASPFVDWDVSDRYAHRSNFGAARVVSHRMGADHVRRLIKKALREALI